MEKSILTSLADNPLLLEALKNEFEKVYNVNDFDTSQDNETLGQNVRAFQMTKGFIKQVFREIEKHKTIPDHKEKINPAR
jgi:preprotein translocase subunit SecA